jgi:hypothetical protein
MRDWARANAIRKADWNATWRNWLLCLNHDNPAYPTKLYLTEQAGGGLNWNETAYLLGRSCSWWKSGRATDITAKTGFDPEPT